MENIASKLASMFQGEATDFTPEFEKALEQAWAVYKTDNFTVDSLENNAMECAFSKGFLKGMLFLAYKYNL